MLKIINNSEEFNSYKTREAKKKQADYYVKIVYNMIKEWAEDVKQQKLFKNTSLVAGAIGEFSFNISLIADPVNGPIIKRYKTLETNIKKLRLANTGGKQGASSPTTYTPGGRPQKQITKEGIWQRPNAGQITQDIVFIGKSGRVYAFSVKNYLSSMLSAMIAGNFSEAALTIRTGKKMNTFMGDIIRGTVLTKSKVSIDEINRFVYVLVNDIFRDGNSDDLLNMFMGSLINFYLQNEFIRTLTHASKEILKTYGDVRNSFIVMAGMYLVPMSAILRSIRDNLQLALERSYGDSIANSLFVIPKMNTGGIALPGADFEQEKEDIKAKDGFYENGVYSWPGAPSYGSAMLSLGIGEGKEIYEQLTMPDFKFNIEKLISVIENAMR